MDNLDIRLFKPQKSSTIFLNRHIGTYENIPVILQTLSVQDQHFVLKNQKGVIENCIQAREGQKNLACISGYSLTPVFSSIAWSFFNNSRYLGDSLSTLSITSRVIITIGLIYGLSHLHSKNIVHGSLTPYSIILTPSDEPIIGFYGINEQIPTKCSCNINNSLIQYIDPQVLNGQAPLYQNSDIYSFGQIIASLALGRFLNPKETIDVSTFEPYFRFLYQSSTQNIHRKSFEDLKSNLISLWSKISSIPNIDVKVISSFVKKIKNNQPDIILPNSSHNSSKLSDPFEKQNKLTMVKNPAIKKDNSLDRLLDSIQLKKYLEILSMILNIYTTGIHVKTSK